MNLNGKKVLVTGADGFIGSHLVEKLCMAGADVTAFVQYNSFNDWGWLEFVSKDVMSSVTVIPGDVRDFSSVKAAVIGNQLIFHLAALIAIPFSYEAPKSYIETNVNGTLNVLQACNEYSKNVERIVITSTSEVYGTALYAPIDERHPLQAQSPYSASKIAADKVAESFIKSFGLPISIARPFNTYGPRQSARAIIPTIITQLLSGSATLNLGDLTPTRDLVFVEDTVQGFVEIASNDHAIGKELNIATGKEYSMGFIANLLIEAINPGVELITSQERKRPPQSEVYRLIGDGNLLRSISGWSPNTDLKDGLIKTVEWFKDNPNYLSRYKSQIYNK